MTKIKVTEVTTTRDITFAVVLVPPGAAYGREDCLTNDSGKTMVEFYDIRYPHTEHGQFVTRYYVSTLLEDRSRSRGLCLDGGIPAWSLDPRAFGEAMDAVVAAL
jgi:hypothetical protein